MKQNLMRPGLTDGSSRPDSTWSAFRRWQSLSGLLSLSLFLTLLLQTGCLFSAKKQQSELVPTLAAQPAPEAGVLQGTVTYLQRIALPPSAVVHLSLGSRDKSAGELKELLAKTIQRPGQVPIEFELELPADDYRAGSQYFITAQIMVDDELLFASEAPQRVFEQGSPCHVQLILKPPRQNQTTSETDK